MLPTGLISALLDAASETPTDFLPGLGQLGLGALLVAPMSAWAWVLWRRNLALTSQIDALNEARRLDLLAQIERERELSSRMLPTLAESAEVIAKAPGLYRQAAEQQMQTDELRRLLTEMQVVLPRLREQ